MADLRHAFSSPDAGSVPVRAVEAVAEVLAMWDGWSQLPSEEDGAGVYRREAGDALQAALDTGEIVVASEIERQNQSVIAELAAVREERDRLREATRAVLEFARVTEPNPAWMARSVQERSATEEKALAALRRLVEEGEESV